MMDEMVIEAQTKQIGAILNEMVDHEVSKDCERFSYNNDFINSFFDEIQNKGGDLTDCLDHNL